MGSNFHKQRIEAIEWWYKLSFERKLFYTTEYYPDRMVSSLTGREIQTIYDAQ